MKMNIQITKIGTGFLESDKVIADIDICNGNWKYTDNLMESEDKIPLTLNTIRKSHYLDKPVKDAYPFYDHDKLVNDDEIVVTGAMVRTYDNLLDFINCRIKNTKEDHKRHGWTERTFEAILFEKVYVRATEDDVVANISYESKGLIEVRMEIIE